MGHEKVNIGQCRTIRQRMISVDKQWNDHIDKIFIIRKSEPMIPEFFRVKENKDESTESKVQ